MLRLMMALILIGLIARSIQAPVPHSRPASPETTRDVRGFGLTVNDAKNEAVRKIVEELTIELMRQKPPVNAWQPSEDYVLSNLLDGPGQQGPDIQVDQLGTAKTWIYKVRNVDMSVFVALDESERRVHEAGQRQKMAGLAIASICGVIALGLVIARLKR